MGFSHLNTFYPHFHAAAGVAAGGKKITGPGHNQPVRRGQSAASDPVAEAGFAFTHPHDDVSDCPNRHNQSHDV